MANGSGGSNERSYYRWCTWHSYSQFQSILSRKADIKLIFPLVLYTLSTDERRAGSTTDRTPLSFGYLSSPISLVRSEPGDVPGSTPIRSTFSLSQSSVFATFSSMRDHITLSTPSATSSSLTPYHDCAMSSSLASLPLSSALGIRLRSFGDRFGSNCQRGPFRPWLLIDFNPIRFVFRCQKQRY